MGLPNVRRVVSCVVLATMAACGGDDENEATPSGQPTQPAAQEETVIAKAQGGFVPGTPLVVELPGYAILKVPGDAFTSARVIEVKAVVSLQTATAWADTAGIFLPTAVTDHEIRVITGDAAPLTDLTLKAIAPDSFVAAVPQSSEISAFVQLLQDTELDRFDSFEYLESSYASAQREVDSTLPSFSFTDARQNSGGRFTAIVKLASTPTPQPDVAQSQSVQRLAEVQHQAAAPVPTRCLGKVKRPPILASPLDRQLSASQYFHLTPATHSVTGKLESHTGVDLSANGDIVKASIDGIVEIPKYERSVSGRGCGYGVTIRSRRSVFCHLLSSWCEPHR